MLKVWGEYYEAENRFVVYVNGHPLLTNDYHVGYGLAEDAGQSWFNYTFFPRDGGEAQRFENFIPGNKPREVKDGEW